MSPLRLPCLDAGVFLLMNVSLLPEIVAQISQLEHSISKSIPLLSRHCLQELTVTVALQLGAGANAANWKVGLYDFVVTGGSVIVGDLSSGKMDGCLAVAELHIKSRSLELDLKLFCLVFFVVCGNRLVNDLSVRSFPSYCNKVALVDVLHYIIRSMKSAFCSPHPCLWYPALVGFSSQLRQRVGRPLAFP